MFIYIFHLELTKPLLLSREWFNCSASENEISCRNVLNSAPRKQWSTNGQRNKSWIFVQFDRLYSVSKVRIYGSIGPGVNIEYTDSISARQSFMIGNSPTLLDLTPQGDFQSMNISFDKNNNAMTVVKEIRFYGFIGMNTYYFLKLY